MRGEENTQVCMAVTYDAAVAWYAYQLFDEFDLLHGGYLTFFDCALQPQDESGMINQSGTINQSGIMNCRQQACSFCTMGQHVLVC